MLIAFNRHPDQPVIPLRFSFLLLLRLNNPNRTHREQASNAGRFFRKHHDVQRIAISSQRRRHKTKIKWKNVAQRQQPSQPKKAVLFVVIELISLAFRRLDDHIYRARFFIERRQLLERRIYRSGHLMPPRPYFSRLHRPPDPELKRAGRWLERNPPASCRNSFPAFPAPSSPAALPDRVCFPVAPDSVLLPNRSRLAPMSIPYALPLHSCSTRPCDLKMSRRFPHLPRPCFSAKFEK